MKRSQEDKLEPNPVEFAPGHLKDLAQMQFGPSMKLFTHRNQSTLCIVPFKCVLLQYSAHA